MAYMIDVEGANIPETCGRKNFDLDLFNWGNGAELSIGIPTTFLGDSFDYNGCAVLVVPLLTVLDEYIEGDFISDSGKGPALELINQLERRIKNMKIKLSKIVEE